MIRKPSVTAQSSWGPSYPMREASRLAQVPAHVLRYWELCRLLDPIRTSRGHRRYRQADPKHLYYVSIEYLPGRMLVNNLSNLGIYDLCRDTLRQMGTDLDLVEECEPDAALGNGGLGRLAAPAGQVALGCGTRSVSARTPRRAEP